MINRIVYAKKTVVGILEFIDGDWRILRVVALQVQRELWRNASRVDLGIHASVSFVHQCKYAVVHIVVEQDYALLRATDKVANESIGIEDLTIEKNALCGLDTAIVQTLKNLFKFLFSVSLSSG